jgi:uncharacterized protein YbjT (DUF2867 family)
MVQQRTVLVLGASGYVGSHLVPRLIERGYRVRASARQRDVLASRGWDCEIVEVDALRPETLTAALDGVEIAYYLVHSMGAGRGFAERDRQAADHFRAAAEAAGVRRIIYLGGLQPAGALSEHLASRRETGERLRAGSVPVTELRAGVIVGPGSAAFEVIRDLVLHLPLMVTPRWVRSRTQPIALDDLIEYLVRLLEVGESTGQTYDVAGSETLSYQQMLQTFARVVGKRIRIVPVPVLTPRLSSYWLDLVTAVPASVARPLIDGLRHDLLAHDEPIHRLIPIPLRDYEQAVRAALEAERADAVTARWAEGSLVLRRDRQDVAFYSKRLTASTEAAAPAARLWERVASIGGDRGWYYQNWLWRLRGLLDRLIGGVGMRRGRRHPQDVRVGDAIDFWRVVGVDPGRRLLLVAEMKLPGSASLELEVEPLAEGRSALATTARFHPAGAAGLLYWYVLWPLHGWLFRGMTRAICEAAGAGIDTREAFGEELGS